MTDHPITFSAPMVCAILDGRKTMTRWVLSPQPAEDIGLWLAERKPARWIPGDHLWVKETWQYYDWTEDGQPWVRYRADDASLLRDPPEGSMPGVLDQWITLSAPENMAIDGRARDRKWRTAMPRWASRITLLVTDVRVERLQQITSADAIAEGFRPYANSATIDCSTPDPRDDFIGMWEHRHGPDAWAANPWVSATKFVRVP